MLTNQIRKNLVDICAIVGKKHGWLADCKEAGFTDEELKFMEEVDEKINDIDDIKFIENWKRPTDEVLRRTREGQTISDGEIRRARECSLENIVPELKGGKRIPCPFHNGKDNNFGVKNGRGHCFTCGENADSIKWLMEIDGMKFPEAVRKLQ